VGVGGLPPPRIEPTETRSPAPQLRSIFKPSFAPMGDIEPDTSAA
jgi:hypothetical protein